MVRYVSLNAQTIMLNIIEFLPCDIMFSSRHDLNHNITVILFIVIHTYIATYIHVLPPYTFSFQTLYIRRSSVFLFNCLTSTRCICVLADQSSSSSIVWFSFTHSIIVFVIIGICSSSPFDYMTLITGNLYVAPTKL